MGFLSLTIITEQNIYFKNLQGSSHRPRAGAESTAQKAADSFPPEGEGKLSAAWFYLQFAITATASAELTALSRFTSARRNFRTDTFSKSAYLPL